MWADFWRKQIGVNVIPANTKYKKPLVPWTEWQTKPIPDSIHEKWKNDAAFQSGMAVVVGKCWHNPLKTNLYLCCIDCDNEAAVKEFCRKGIEDAGSKTLVEWHRDNPNKVHVYFYTDAPVPKKSAEITAGPSAPAFEVKGDGKHGIMYCTPSPHKDGFHYEIVNNKEPLFVRASDLVKEITAICKKHGIRYAESDLMPMEEILSDGTQIYEGNNRHLAMLRFADKIYLTTKNALSDGAIFEILKIKNSRMCVPPLPDEDLASLQKQAKQKVQEWQDGDGDKSHTEVADEIMNAHHFATLDDTDELLWYDEGVYRYGGEVIVRKLCEQIKLHCSRHFVDEVIATIKRRTYVARNEFDVEQNMLNLKNCWVNIATGQTFEHTPARLSRVQLPVFYDPTKHPFKFVRFIRECIDNQNDLYTVWEQFASCLVRSAKFGKAYMYIGLGSNGKSTFLQVMRAFFGAQNVSHVSIHRLEESRFAAAELDGKIANIHPDIGSDELKTTGVIKALITGDPISVEKKHKPPFTLCNFAKLFFSANQIPNVYDESEGFFRRFSIIEWNKVFEQPDRNILSELVTEEEKSGIFNLLVRFAVLLQKRGGFKYEPTVAKAREIWRTKANSTQQFFDTKLAYSDDYIVAKARLYAAYKEFCRQNKVPAKSMRRFHDDVKQLTTLIDDPNPKHIDGKTVKVWRGAALKEDFPVQETLA